MKTFKIALIVALLGALGLAGGACSLFSKGSPTAALTAYFEASKKKDVPAMKKYLSKKSLELFEAEAKKSGQALDDYLKEGVADPGSVADMMPEIRNEKVSGDTATVEMKRAKSDQWDTVPFVKEDDEWKIAFDRLVATPSPAPAAPK